MVSKYASSRNKRFRILCSLLQYNIHGFEDNDCTDSLLCNLSSSRFVCIPEKFDAATVLFSDIVSFTNIAAAVHPVEIVTMLNDLYTRFDSLTGLHNVYKVSVMLCTGQRSMQSVHRQHKKMHAFNLHLDRPSRKY